MQKYFHIAKLGYIEAVCSNIKESKKAKHNSFLVRVKKFGAQIEIKRDLARFEDPFYEFQKVNFPGLEKTTILSFVPYCIPDKPNLIMLSMMPQLFANRAESKQMYFIIIDLTNLSASECEFSEGAYLLNSIYFCSS